MNELQQVQLLLDQLINALQQTFQAGEEIPDELQGQIAQELEYLFNRINQLSQPTQIPELSNAPFPSSNIHAFKYDPETQKLFIKFQDKYPNTNGPIYQYENIPKFIFDVFSRGAVGPKTSGANRWHRWQKGITPSLGAAAHALIKSGGYQYQRVA